MQFRWMIRNSLPRSHPDLYNSQYCIPVTDLCMYPVYLPEDNENYLLPLIQGTKSSNSRHTWKKNIQSRDRRQYLLFQVYFFFEKIFNFKKKKFFCFFLNLFKNFLPIFFFFFITTKKKKKNGRR